MFTNQNEIITAEEHKFTAYLPRETGNSHDLLIGDSHLILVIAIYYLLSITFVVDEVCCSYGLVIQEKDRRW